ncbi:hypothetical protein ABPG74_009919 [Tetrahymena malaccensis]
MGSQRFKFQNLIFKQNITYRSDMFGAPYLQMKALTCTLYSILIKALLSAYKFYNFRRNTRFQFFSARSHTPNMAKKYLYSCNIVVIKNNFELLTWLQPILFGAQ